MIEMRTLAFSFLMSMALQAIVIGLLWMQNRKRFAGLNFWVLCYFLTTIGLGLLALPNIVPPFFSMVVANVINLGALILLYHGLRLFIEKRGLQYANLIILIAFVLVHLYFTMIEPSVRGRIINQSAAISIVWIQCAWLMLYRVSVSFKSGSIYVGLVCLLLCLNSIVRIVLNLIYHQGDTYFTSGTLNVMSYMISQTLLIALTFCLFLIVSNRLNRELESDIFRRKLVEEQLKFSLEEKKTLLQEIHHRVKNNMVVVSGLLNLQANNMKDERLKAALSDSQSRLQAMSDIHEILYKSDNLSAVDMNLYLTKLTRDVVQNYTLGNRVSFKIKAELILIGTRQASPIGLIINELITNSLKYAFPDTEEGEIKINLQKTEDQIELTYMDNGIGIPDNFDWYNTKSMGLNLVKMLAENQLDGSIDMESNNGTKFTIIFNIET